MDKDLANLYKYIVLYYNEDRNLNFDKFEKYLLEQDQQLVKQFTTLSLFADKEFLGFSNDQIKTEIINIIKTLQKNSLQNKIFQLQQELVQAEKNNQQHQIKELLPKITQLTEELNNYQ